MSQYNIVFWLFLLFPSPRNVNGVEKLEAIDRLLQSNSTNLLFPEGALDLPISPQHTSLWGPGLVPHEIILPARYFFVELKGKNGKRLRRVQVDKEELRVRIDCSGDRQVWNQVLDGGDEEHATFIVRYKTITTCHNHFRIIITYSHIHLANSPIQFSAPVLPDVCNCPQLEAREWLKSVGCPRAHDQLLSDLRPFAKGSVDFDQSLERILEQFHRPSSHSFCHYVIVKNTVHRKCYGQHTGFHIFPDAILLFLTRRMWMNDIEFVMNLGDWPLLRKERSKGHDVETLPIFSWCKTSEFLDILLPTYELTEASLENMGRVSVDMLSVAGNVGIPWQNKTNQIFWRGRDSRQERLDLIKIGRGQKNLINASLTHFFFFREQEAEYGPTVPKVSFFTFFNHKYQLNIDGTVASYRFPFLLGGDAVVFKVDSPYIEHFYRDLSPHVHYVPVKADLSDLVAKVKWAQEHDEKVKVIGNNARKYAQRNLLPLDVFCYHANAYTEWAARLKNPVVVLPGMEVVKQAKMSHGRVCECPENGQVKGHVTTREKRTKLKGRMEL